MPHRIVPGRGVLRHAPMSFASPGRLSEWPLRRAGKILGRGLLRAALVTFSCPRPFIHVSELQGARAVHAQTFGRPASELGPGGLYEPDCPAHRATAQRDEADG